MYLFTPLKTITFAGLFAFACLFALPVHAGVAAGKPWPDGIIYYQYAPETFTPKLQHAIESGINEWLKGAPYLKFERVRYRGPSPRVVTVNGDGLGCRSSLGSGWSSHPTINLGPSCQDSLTVATHELGHILGLYHEHQRPDREKYVHFACENLYCPNMPPWETCCSPNVSSCCMFRNGPATFQTYPTSNGWWTTPYDLDSIMHYDSSAAAKFGRMTLIPARPGVVIPHHVSPSQGDFETVCHLYKEQCDRQP